MIFDEELLADKWLTNPKTHFLTLQLAGTPKWKAALSAAALYLRNRLSGR